VYFYGAAILIEEKELLIPRIHIKKTYFYFLNLFMNQMIAYFPQKNSSFIEFWRVSQQEMLVIIILRMMSELNTGSMRSVCSSLPSTQTFILQRLANRAEDIDAGSFTPEPSNLFDLLNLDLRPTCQSSTVIAGTIRLPS
jgi:hypothetical protein